MGRPRRKCVISITVREEMDVNFILFLFLHYYFFLILFFLLLIADDQAGKVWCRFVFCSCEGMRIERAYVLCYCICFFVCFEGWAPTPNCIMQYVHNT